MRVAAASEAKPGNGLSPKKRANGLTLSPNALPGARRTK